MNKLFLIAALLVATFCAKAQNATKEQPYIGIKCPQCPTLAVWQYETARYIEVFTNPDTRAQILIDWDKMLVQADGKKYRFEYWTNDKEQSQTIKYGDSDHVKFKVFYDKNAHYVGHIFLAE